MSDAASKECMSVSMTMLLRSDEPEMRGKIHVFILAHELPFHTAIDIQLEAICFSVLLAAPAHLHSKYLCRQVAKRSSFKLSSRLPSPDEQHDKRVQAGTAYNVPLYLSRSCSTKMLIHTFR